MPGSFASRRRAYSGTPSARRVADASRHPGVREHDGSGRGLRRRGAGDRADLAPENSRSSAAAGPASVAGARRKRTVDISAGAAAGATA